MPPIYIFSKYKNAFIIIIYFFICVVEPSNGKGKLGLLQVIGFANERVSEGSDRLNEFELIHNPIPSTARKKRTTKKAAESK